MHYRAKSGKTRTIRERIRRLLQRLVSWLLTQPFVQFRYFRFQLLGINVPFASHFFQAIIPIFHFLLLIHPLNLVQQHLDLLPQAALVFSVFFTHTTLCRLASVSTFVPSTK